MRSREEIFEEYTERVNNELSLQRPLLEVLLDIRDTLHNREKSEPQTIKGDTFDPNERDLEK